MKNNIRNFSIIAHIDHGKTTLTDRFLEVTKTVDPRLMHERYLDSHPISQERGVTIKLAPVRMSYLLNSQFYILNLIDTPGHIDFAYEVSRSLACCEGAILLVDATQGIQAQTLAHYHLAKKQGLVIIPVVNKIDLSNAEPNKIASEMIEALEFKKEEIIFISARTGENIIKVLEAVVQRIPSPKGNSLAPLRALIFNSLYHPYKGVIAYLRIVDGCLDLPKQGSVFQFYRTKQNFTPIEIGYFAPQMKKIDRLEAGEVGYIATGLKEMSLCQVGDTIIKSQILDLKSKIFPLPGYREPKSVVFFDFYPVENKDFPLLEDALKQLKLNDYSLHFNPIGSPALGKGFRVGFLGVFHAFITQERLERDFDLDIIITSPSVEYQVVTKNGLVNTIQNASDLPDPSVIKEVREPWVKLSIFSPMTYLGNIFKICQESRGVYINQKYYGTLANLEYEMPLIELISGFYDKLKSASSGFASLDYEFSGFKPFEALKLEVLIHRQKVDALAMIVAKEKGEYIARSIAKKLKETISRQMFELVIQVTLNGRVFARETLKAFRKDVTAKLYGGDQTRKDKLLKKQKKGKKRMKMIGSVNIPQEAFMAILKIE